MLSDFYSNYQATFGEELKLPFNELLRLFKKHPNIGPEFENAFTSHYEPLTMQHMPELLEYIHGIVEKQTVLFPTFRQAYFEAYGDELTLSDATLSEQLRNHEELGQTFFNFRHDVRLQTRHIAQNMTEFLSHIHKFSLGDQFL